MSTVLLRRGAVIWVLARLLLGGATVASGSGGAVGPFDLEVWTLIPMLLVVGALGWLETRRQHEHRLLANLGVGPLAVTALLVLPSLIGEFVSALVLAP